MSELHECNIVDDDHHFIIDPVSRTIRNSANDSDDYYGRPVLVCGDKNSERFTFEIPLEIEGHNMSECDRIEVHYINIDSTGENQSADIYEATDAEVDGDRVTFSWLISSNATKYIGTLSFAVKFLCFNTEIENGVQAQPGDIEYAWNTKPLTGANIDEGYDNKAAIVDEYADILQEWYNRFDTRLINKVDKMSFVDETTLSNPQSTADRPFSEELYRKLLERERVYMEKSENDGKGLSPLYIFTANADKIYNPYGYASLSELCTDWGLDESKVKAGTEYVVKTENGVTSYHARMFTAAARMPDGSIRGIITDASSSDTLVNKGFVEGKLSLKINMNSISTSKTTPNYNQDKVLFRAKNGGAYSGIPVAVESIAGAKSIPRFNDNGELIGATNDSSPNTALVNKQFLTGKLGLKIDKNSISATRTTDCVLFRPAKGGSYSGIPVGTQSLGGNSIPRFTGKGELMGYSGDDSESGVLINKGYASGLDAKVLSDAKSYADGKVIEASKGLAQMVLDSEASAKSYADGKASTAESNAKKYADDKVGALVIPKTSDLESTMDSKDSKTLASAKSYADSKVGALVIPKTSDLESTMDSKDNKTLASAKSYADSKVGALVIPKTSDLESTMDSKDNKTLESAKSYTNGKVDALSIPDVQPFATSALPEWLSDSDGGFKETSPIPSDDHINQLIDTALGGIVNGEF